jgi:hypothetical protein
LAVTVVREDSGYAYKEDLRQVISPLYFNTFSAGTAAYLKMAGSRE